MNCRSGGDMKSRSSSSWETPCKPFPASPGAPPRPVGPAHPVLGVGVSVLQVAPPGECDRHAPGSYRRRRAGGRATPNVTGMPSGNGAPDEDLRRVAAANARFLRAIETLTDADVGRSSDLEGWSRGHLLTHLARNADSHCRRAQAAARGDVVEQYAGGFEGRAAEIEAGARRSAEALIADCRTSAAALATVWSDLPPGAWSNVTRDVGGRERPLSALPARRWQELEVHLVDLDVGVSYADWSDDFVDVFLPKLRSTVDERLPSGAALPPSTFKDPREELAWLYGRVDRPD